MLYRQLCLAATAAAFLVVPEVTEADKDVISTLPAPVDAAHPVLMPSDLHLDIPYHQEGGADAAISLNFLVEGGSRLTLNGFELYPSADPWHGDLTAEVEAHDGAREEKTLGYGLFVKPEVSDAEQQLSLVAIDLQLLEVGGVFDKGLPKVEIKLIKGPTGDIVIGSVDAVVETVEEKANNPLLRIKEKVEEFWKKLSSGCGRHRKGSAKHGHFETYEGGRPFRHDSLHGHHRHGGHRHRHDWGRLLKNIAANIVLPVLAGITAGVGVAVLTMGLCSCFALIFRARRRRSRRAARQSEAASTEPAFAEEKAGLMEAQEEYEDAPPQYQDAEQTTEQTK